MSSSNITQLQSEANNLNYIAMMFVRCYCYLAMPFGVVGHLLNIYVFARPSLRSNPCTRYFLAATAIGMITTLYTLPMRMVQSGYIDTDPGAYSTVFCKMTWLVQYSIRHVESSEIRVSFLIKLITQKH
jgi:ABC-type Mn2+/Zn2+ transport system permease subunit